MTKWTEEQSQAIWNRKSNLLVSAAAGSGKTAVLVQRIIGHILEDKTDVDRLLVVTFTNAAAGEMRNRIRGALTKEMAVSKENKKFLSKQMNLLPQANIMTLHKFCIEVVRSHFYAVDVEPTFRIGSPSEIDILMEETMELVMENSYENSDKAFYNLVEMYAGNRSDEEIKKWILKVYTFIQSQPEPLIWLSEKIDLYAQEEKLRGSEWTEGALSWGKGQLEKAIQLIEEAVKLCERKEGPYPYKETLMADKELCELLIKACSGGWEKVYGEVLKNGFVRLKTIKKAEKEKISDELISEVKALRDLEKEKFVRPFMDLVGKKSPKQHEKELGSLKAPAQEIYRLVKAFHENYTEAKKEKNILDFNDLEHLTIEILKNEDIASGYRERFVYVFMDEYQDANIVQETIINKLKRKDNLFLVGDVKQSIYRFRLADPSLFLKKYKAYKNPENLVDKSLHLTCNFRSRAEILEGINGIFEKLMNKNLGEISYDLKARLNPGLPFPSHEKPPLEFYTVDYKADEKLQEQSQKEMGTAEIEAHVVAKRIQALINDKLYDSKLKKWRFVRFSDIVILFRATKNWSSTFVQVFSEYGIPLYTDGGNQTNSVIEVDIFVSFLKLIDNWYQDLPLIAVLRSPIGGFSLEEISEIRKNKDKETFHKAFFHMTQIESSLGEKTLAFKKKLVHWRKEERRVPLNEFLWQCLMETGFYHYVGAMPGGEARQANLRFFVERARQFEQSSFDIAGLYGFLNFLEKAEQAETNLGGPSLVSEQTDSVRIMSIHKSKGLEFPIVILAGMGKAFNLRDASEKILLHRKYGIGLRYVDWKKRFYTETLPQSVMKQTVVEETIAEEMRILYVAMTRAVDRLILVGTSKNFDRDIQKWQRGSALYNLSLGRTYLDWVSMILLEQEVSKRAIDETKKLTILEECGVTSSKWQIQKIRKDEGLIHGFDTLFPKGNLPSEQSEIFEEGKMIQNDPNQSKETNALIKEINIAEEIQRRLNWVYPHKNTMDLPFKLSVTDMNRLEKNKRIKGETQLPDLVPSPQFLEKEEGMSPAEKGTLYHFFMQILDLKGDLSESGIKIQLENFIEKGILESKARNVLEAKKVSAFFQTPLGKRLVQSRKIFREVPFIYKAPFEEGHILVQGVVDCYFEEEEKIVVLDYKTDRLNGKNPEKVALAYEKQVALYKQALEELTGKEVKEAYIYFFEARQNVSMTRNL